MGAILAAPTPDRGACQKFLWEQSIKFKLLKNIKKTRLHHLAAKQAKA
jgi:hypothetical protein